MVVTSQSALLAGRQKQVNGDPEQGVKTSLLSQENGLEGE
jgi:hypothetical protein